MYFCTRLISSKGGGGGLLVFIVKLGFKRISVMSEFLEVTFVLKRALLKTVVLLNIFVCEIFQYSLINRKFTVTFESFKKEKEI